jgi:hypothetical protein
MYPKFILAEISKKNLFLFPTMSVAESGVSSVDVKSFASSNTGKETFQMAAQNTLINFISYFHTLNAHPLVIVVSIIEILQLLSLTTTEILYHGVEEDSYNWGIIDSTFSVWFEQVRLGYSGEGDYNLQVVLMCLSGVVLGFLLLTSYIQVRNINRGEDIQEKWATKILEIALIAFPAVYPLVLTFAIDLTHCDFENQVLEHFPDRQCFDVQNSIILGVCVAVQISYVLYG